MIKRKIILLFSAVLIAGISFGQTFYLRGTVPGMSNKDVYLLQDFANSQRMLDTVRTDISGSFDFTMGADMPVGMYRIMTPAGQMFDVIYNRENIDFVATGMNASDLIQVKQSVENLIYYKYLRVKTTNELKIKLFIENYPVLGDLQLGVNICNIKKQANSISIGVSFDEKNKAQVERLLLTAM